MTKLYIVHKDGNEDYVCTTDTLDFHAELKKQGAVVMNESTFVSIQSEAITENDTVMVHVGLASDEAKTKLKHFLGRKVLFTIDESKSDGVLFRTHREFCEQIACREIVLTYPSERNVRFLQEHGYKTISHNPSVTVREKKEKKYDIIISGQLDRNYYPTRVYLAEIIINNKNRWNVVHLPHPGFERSKATHSFTGEKYRELLDECRLGVVCRAGWRDRLVAKYVELGASWCLPIGDAPSYMHDVMKQSMIMLDSSSSEEEVIRAIDAALDNPDEKLEVYVDVLKTNHDLCTNTQKLVLELTK